MSYRLLVTALALVFLLCPGLTEAGIQHPNFYRGSTAGSQSAGELDSVNLFNGNLNVRIPIGQTYSAGGNLSYGLGLSYNSKLWDWDTALTNCGTQPLPRAQANRDNNAGFGWQIGLGRLAKPNTSRNPGDLWIYIAADGAEHVFYSTLHQGDSSTANIFYTRDGSYLRLDTSGSTEILEFPDGSIHSFDSGGQLVSMADRGGNQLTITYGTNTWTLSDGYRTHTLTFQTRQHDLTNVPMLKKIDLAAFGNTRAVYTFEYSTTFVDRPEEHDTCTLNGQARLSILTKINLPDGSYYQPMSHQLSRTTANPHSPGVMTRLKLPTLGSIQWDFGIYEFPTYYPTIDPNNPGPTFFEASGGVVARRLLGANGSALPGDWTYTPSITLPADFPVTPPKEMQTEVVDPLGHRTVHYFQAYDWDIEPGADGIDPRMYGMPFTPLQMDGQGRFLSKQIFDDAGSDNRSIYVKFERDSAGSVPTDGSKYDVNRRLKQTRTSYGGKWKILENSNFDGLGNYRTTKLRGNLRLGTQESRTVTTNFNPGGMPSSSQPWILGTFDSQSAVENYADLLQGATSGWTRDFCFDSATGRLLRLRLRESSGSIGNDDVIITYEYFANGDLQKEKYWGGDNQYVSAAGGLCGLTLPSVAEYQMDHTYSYGSLATTKVFGIGYHPYRATIDANTGLPSSRQDPSDLTTAFEYDSLGRPTWVKPSTTSQEAWQHIVYDRATSSSSLSKIRFFGRPNNSTTNVLTEAQTHFDALGRPVEERRRIPDANWIFKDTTYNRAGLVASQSTWAKVGTSAKGWTRYDDYDPYGRPLLITLPDGNASSDYHTIRYSYFGEHTVSYRPYVGTGLNADGSPREEKVNYGYDFDFLGRIWKVREPGTGLTATHAYNAAGQMTNVQLSANGVNQYRTFGYDGRGFATSQTHPESGTYTFDEIDSMGNARLQSHGSGGRDLGYHFDAAGRLTEIYRRGDGQSLKKWVYGSSNLSGDWRKNKVIEAKRWNHRPIPGDTSNSFPLVVTESYQYGGRGGRVSYRKTHVTGGTEFEQSWVYDALGNRTRIDYPECTHAQCTDDGGPSRTIFPTHALGMPTGVSGTATLAYHENGTLASVTHQNGVVDSYERDPWNLPRPRNVSFDLPSGLSLSLGTHLYDGSGNLIRRQDPVASCSGAGPCDHYYLYDQAGRLTKFHDRDGLYEEYDYDAFGNLEAITEFDGTSAQTRNISVDSATNRLDTLVSYDAFGNLTSRYIGQPETYTYDEFDMLATRNNSAYTYIYTADDERLYTLEVQTGQPWRAQYELRDLDGSVLRTYSYDDQGAVENWTWEKDYVYAGGRLVGAFTNEASPRNRYTFTLDHLGSVRVVTDANGDPIEDHHFMGYGRDYGAFSGIGSEDMQFTGHQRDQNAAGSIDDLDYMHARYYLPHSGRFTTPDPVLGLPEDPQTWNRYTYARSSPLVYTDPDGRFIQAAIGAARTASIFVHFERITILERSARLGALPLRFPRSTPVNVSGKAFVPANTASNSKILGGEYHGEDIVEFFFDALAADGDFLQNYLDMRAANTIGADKYFHCKANCQAARRGLGGVLESLLVSELRELSDQYIKGDPAFENDADRAANDHGREAGMRNRNVDCSVACLQFRPRGLDPRYY